MNLDITHLEITAHRRAPEATRGLLSRQKLQVISVICTYIKTGAEARHGRDQKKRLIISGVI